MNATLIATNAMSHLQRPPKNKIAPLSVRFFFVQLLPNIVQIDDGIISQLDAKYALFLPKGNASKPRHIKIQQKNRPPKNQGERFDDVLR